MLCWKERWKPLISETIPITVPTPITMPSSASADRMRFATSARLAMNSVSRIMNRFIGSLVPQRFDRIELRRAIGRVRPEEHSDQGGHDDAHHQRGQAHRGGQRTDHADDQRER